MKIITGDITKLENVDVIVNAADVNLHWGDGVCGAIFNAACGEDLEKACQSHPFVEYGVRCPTGSARLTGAFDLPNYAIVHAVGPRYSEDVDFEGQKNELARAYTSALDLAQDYSYKSIAFPAISFCIFKFHLEEAAHNSVKEILDWEKTNGIFDSGMGTPERMEVQIVFLPFGDGPQLQAIFEKALAELTA